MAAFPRTLVSKFYPKLPICLLTPSSLLPFQPPDLNPVRRGGSLALNVHKNATQRVNAHLVQSYNGHYKICLHILVAQVEASCVILGQLSLPNF